MTILQQLENHPYLDKKGNPINNPRINTQDVLDAFTYLIEKSKGKLTTRILRLAFTDKAKDFTSVLIMSDFIKLTKKSNTIKISFGDGGNKFVSTPNIYKCINNNVDVTNNRYIKSLYTKLEGRQDDYGWLYDIISDTLSRTTLDGKAIDTEFRYKGGRYYTEYTGMAKNDRKRLKIDGKKTLSYDIKSSVFQLLSYNNIEGIEPMDLSNDIYKQLDKEFGMNKETVLKQVFCNVWQQDTRLDVIPFFSSLRDFKYKMGYKTVHYIYQLCETRLMDEIYSSLALNKIDFLPMHDSLIFKETDYSTVTDMVRGITNVTFKIEY